MAWQDLGTALALVLVIEGIVPFLYPARWRRAVALLAEMDERSMRIAGLVSMLLGLLVLAVVRTA